MSYQFRADCYDCEKRYPASEKDVLGVFYGGATISNEPIYPKIYPISGQLITECVAHHVGLGSSKNTHRKYSLHFEGGITVGDLIVTSANQDEGLFSFVES